MKRSIVVYAVTLLLITASFFFVKRVYDEWILYSRLAGISNRVLSIFQDLHVKINKASVLNPDLAQEVKKHKRSDLFYSDSASIRETLVLLKNTIADTANEKTAEKLDYYVMPELSWIISSNVTDSIIQGKSSQHIGNFIRIDSLLNAGEKRTQFLIGYRTAKMGESFKKLITLLITFVLIYLSVLLLALWNFYHERKAREKRETELSKKEEYFHRTLDGMIEGIQIHDFEWRYTYINDAALKNEQLTRDELIGKSLLEINPELQKTEIFKVFQRCMHERVTEQIESELVFSNGTKKYFEFIIQPVPEGIFILSVDRTDRKNAGESLLKKNRLYSFLSAINQTIVHSQTEEELLERVTEIAVNIGQFKVVYLGLLNDKRQFQIRNIGGSKEITVRIRQMSGLNIDDPGLSNIPTVRVLKTGEYHFNNDMQGDPALQSWKKEFEDHGICSSISLPLKIFGETEGLLCFHAGVKDFFDKDEIDLLKEAASDISFALENFIKVKKQKEIEALAARNDKRYRALIEKSNDLKTLTNKEGKLIYCSPSVMKTFAYPEEELIGKSFMDFFHPDDLPQIIKSRAEIEDKPGAYYFFQCRIRHKNGAWIWCEGTSSNFLSEPAIEAIVSNFRDISRRYELEQQREFDKNNLYALINNTKDLMWSVDRFFRLITFNKPFDEAARKRFSRSIGKGDELLTEELDNETIRLFGNYYKRALDGEVFSVVSQNKTPDGSWSEISFYPIQRGQEVVGTACFSRDITESRKNASEKEALIKQLTHHNNDLRQFAYITSHNLRAPVANLLGLTNLLDTYNLPDPVLTKILDGIKTATVTFDETLRDLTNVLTTKDNPSVQLEVVNLKEVFEKVKESLIPSFNEFKPEILCDFNEASNVQFNRVYMESVFTNLMTNAIKYRNEKNMLKVNIRTVLEDENVCLTFSDNGIGFDSESNKNKVFQLYQRFHTHKEGKGLGLFLVKSQVESLGGSIQVESKPNQGTTFTIKFNRNGYQNV